jgi:GDP/UDP-N,N'-diacetylbacillosamine 2-epimerase (hydrolysing)
MENKKRIGVLTSSRADYSIYFPLLKKLKLNNNYQVDIIAFGTHLNPNFGHTVDQIIADGFDVPFQIKAIPQGDSAFDITYNIGEVISQFATLWNSEIFDLVFCLGDRFEMFAAVTAGIPFNVTFAHLYGGELTTGAIDDCFRHSMTHMSKLHFTSCTEYKNRVVRLKENENFVWNCGALSYDNFRELKLLSTAEFKIKHEIDLAIPTILTTFHPETVSFEKNILFANELYDCFAAIENYQIVITMPNADTMNNVLREKFLLLEKMKGNVHCVESLGTQGYLSCMQHSSLMLGNSSSGFVEGAWFPKKVINIGDRQNGRIVTSNIINCPIEKNAILHAIDLAEKTVLPLRENIYGDGHAADKIMGILNNYFSSN